MIINTELLRPANFITIGLISLLFTWLIGMSHDLIKKPNGDN